MREFNILRFFTSIEESVFKQYENVDITPRVGEYVWFDGEKYAVLSVEHSYNEAGADMCDCMISHVPMEVWISEYECMWADKHSDCCCCDCEG